MARGVWQKVRQLLAGGPAVFFCAVVLPFIVIGIYAFVTGILLEPSQLPNFHSEAGPIEQITAGLMLVAAGVALTIAFKLKSRGHGRLWQAWYVLIAAGALFVCLEEISYGQHLMGWQAPEYFQEHNKQREMNLHNLYGDGVSSTLRKVVNTALPLGAILVPLVLMRRPESFRRGDWTWYTVPRLEMAVWVAVAGLSSAVRKLGGFTGEGDWAGSLSEFKEMLWACALLMYLGVMWRRMLTREVTPQSDAAETAAGRAQSTQRPGHEAQVAPINRPS